MLETCGYLLQCLLIGYATVMLLFRSKSISWPFAVGFGISIGCCEVALLLFYVGLAGVRPGGGTLFATDAAAIVMIGWLQRGGRSVLPQLPTDWRPSGGLGHSLAFILPAAVVCYVGAAAVRIVTSTPLVGWDAWAIWLYKAKLLASENLIPPPWVFTSASGYGHPHYPILWPMLAAGLYGVVGSIDDHLARLALVFLWIGWGLMTYSALRWKLPRLAAAMVAALQVSLPGVTEYAPSGYADVVLAGFYGGMIYLILPLGDEPEWSVLISAALLGTAAAFTKHEGMPLACFGALMVLAITARHGLARAGMMAGAFIGIVCILMLPWYLWSHNFPSTGENYGLHLWAVADNANLARLKVILPAVGKELLTLGNWGPLWLLLPIAAAIGWRAFRFAHIWVLWVLLAAHFMLYMYVYAISPQDINWLIATTLNRLVIHITPVAILLIGYHWAAIFSSDAPEAVAI